MNPSAEIADRPARILIVDDERPNRQLLEVMSRRESAGKWLWAISCHVVASSRSSAASRKIRSGEDSERVTSPAYTVDLVDRPTIVRRAATAGDCIRRPRWGRR